MKRTYKSISSIDLEGNLLDLKKKKKESREIL